MEFCSTQILLLPPTLLFLLPWGSVRAQQAFVVEPRNTTVRAGSTAVLRCGVLRASGAVQWLKDGLLLGPQRGLPGFPRYSIQGDPSRGQFHLQVERAELGDDGPYECQVGGSESSQPISSNLAWLDVLIPPSEPYFEVASDEAWVAGRRYTVVCVAPDAKPEAQIQLYKDGVELMGVESSSETGSDERLWTTRGEVTVLALSSDDGSLLTCLAKNSGASKPSRTSLTMKVFYPPRPPVIRGLEGDQVKAGSVLRLVCVSQGGNPLAVLNWMKDGEVVTTSWQEHLEGDLSSATLQIKVEPADNQAVFSCLSLSLVMSSPLAVSRKITVIFEPAKVDVEGSYEVVEGDQLELLCVTTSSNPPVSIRWWLGSRELNASAVTVREGDHGGSITTSNLTHLVSRDQDGLPLTCEAFNPGTRISKIRTESLIVLYPPLRAWLSAPPPGPLRSGTRVRLFCFSTGGNPMATLTWLKNGRPVSGAMGPKPFDKGVSRELALVLVPGDNMAAYQCEAGNEAGAVMSAETRLQVLFPAVSVRIVAQQERSRVGQTLGLQCLSGSSNPKANVSWILGARRIPGEEQPPRSAAFGGVSVSSSLALPLVPSYNKQRLICQAYSAVLSEGASTFHTLDVMYPPEFSPAQPRLVQVTEEDTAVLPLLVSANPEELTCTWLHHQDTLITDRDILYQWYEDYSLQIRNVTRRHAGKYTVQCTNEEGRRHTTITLDVLYSPGVRPKSAEVRVVLGAMADLICVADANPAAAFSWAWLGEGEMEFEEETMEEEFGVLTIQEVTRAHAGRYQCIADNGIAPPASAEVELVVCFGPEIKKGVQWSKVASRGDGSVEAEVLCRAEGIPPVSFSWDKNNVPMDFENPRYAERTVRDGSFSTSTVVVLNVSALLDYALFTCHASNALGEDSLQIQLVSTNHPDPPSSVGLVGVSYSSVTLEWIPGFNGGLAQSYRIRYRGPHSNSFTYVDVFPLSTAVYTVTNLAPSTTYNFSIAALNAIGESGYEDAASLVATTDDWFVEDRGGSGEDTGPSGLPMYLTSTLSAVAVVLLASNAVGFVLGWRWRQRRLHTGRSTTSDQSSVLDEKKSEAAGSGGTAGDGSGRYESREKINAAAQRTLITDSGSETQSNVYESYGAESQNYYPLRDYRPRLQPYAEETHRPGETAHYRTDHVHYPVHYPGEPPGHEYETVREFGWRPDVPETPALFPPPDPLGCPQQGSRGLRRPADDGLTSRDYELPFELRGELV